MIGTGYLFSIFETAIVQSTPASPPVWRGFFFSQEKTNEERSRKI